MLWLNEKDISKCVNEKSLIGSIKCGFQSLDADRTEPKRIKADLTSIHDAPKDAQAMILVPGTVPGIPAYTVKVHAKYPNNPSNGLPAIQGVIQLFNSMTGELLAILDSPLVTGHRTAAAGAVAADALAKENASTVAIIGAGFQGEIQFRYLKHVRQINVVHVYDLRESVATEYAKRRRKEGITCNVVSSVEEAVKAADIVVCATWAKEPFLLSRMIKPGTHITTLGPDTAGKVEVAEEVILNSTFVCDNQQMAFTMGALNTFNVDVGFQSVPTLTDVLNGKSNGRLTSEEITVFGSVGLPFQDLVASWNIYNTAISLGIGQRLI
ncbi:ornithine cyclodeaminase family protein [Alicyclobacillus fastidiosus]|uniref:Ornithine cyclodeaminase family protein n=1 Tax=Alicyclobacillus fastidiosus TaxID=392011 RepID=A0ABY6ZGZ7_9BACL|nr:ornithine cyclodeaminase family protein [Alicyclobacillus fastidiosus]WAH41405.1 ornithine cyclodeaminase family protein [Alicyclobacillus fastidiosus]GMA63025.1 ornithine cyclodeaminase 2 [Alicyclobacillus fastidiosus]